MTTTLDIPHSPMAELAKLRIGPSPFPGWYPADTLQKTAELIVTELGAFHADRPDLRPLKAHCWTLLRTFGGSRDPIGDWPNGATAHVALAVHLADAIVKVLAESRR